MAATPARQIRGLGPLQDQAVGSTAKQAVVKNRREGPWIGRYQPRPDEAPQSAVCVPRGSTPYWISEDEEWSRGERPPDPLLPLASLRGRPGVCRVDYASP